LIIYRLMESHRQVNLSRFLDTWEKMSQAEYIHARWFALIDTFLVTSAYSVRLQSVLKIKIF
jgi:hypothetical protein